MFYSNSLVSFSYKNGEASFEVGRRGEQARALPSPTMESVKKSTQSLLRTVVVLTGGLDLLPDTAKLAMKFTYYDEVMPEDYEPAGFQSTALVIPSVAGARSINSGDVTTGHHGVGLQVQVVGRGEESQETEAMEEDVGENMGEAMEVVANNQFVIPVVDPEDEEPALGGISCICENIIPDSLMLLCHFCQQSQHAACYRILEEKKLPAQHCCLPCSQQGEGRACTDSKLQKTSANPAVATTCIFRRVLVALVPMEQVSRGWLGERFGMQSAVEEKILERLQSDGVLSSVEGSEALTTKQEGMIRALKRYLGYR